MDVPLENRPDESAPLADAVSSEVSVTVVVAVKTLVSVTCSTKTLLTPTVVYYWISAWMHGNGLYIRNVRQEGL